MSNISVDLKVIEVTGPMVARALGEPLPFTLGCLNLLWHRCWSLKTDTITAVGLTGIFGPEKLDARIALLVDAGFLEPSGAHFRVRGAERYLRIREGNSKGGHASKRNLIPGGPRGGRAEVEPSPQAEVEPRSSRETTSGPLGSSPNTEHRTPNTEKENNTVEQARLPVVSEDRITQDETDVWQHWKHVMAHPKAVLTKDRLKLIRRWLPVYGVERLQAAVDGCRRSPHHRGLNDRGTVYDDLELILRDAKHIEMFENMPRGT